MVSGTSSISSSLKAALAASSGAAVAVVTRGGIVAHLIGRHPVLLFPDGDSSVNPKPVWYIFVYVRKEAFLRSDAPAQTHAIKRDKFVGWGRAREHLEC